MRSTHMSVHVAQNTELPTTSRMSTCVWFLSCVRIYVRSQTAWAIEPLPAMGALVLDVDAVRGLGIDGVLRIFALPQRANVATEPGIRCRGRRDGQRALAVTCPHDAEVTSGRRRGLVAGSRRAMRTVLRCLLVVWLRRRSRHGQWTRGPRRRILSELLRWLTIVARGARDRMRVRSLLPRKWIAMHSGILCLKRRITRIARCWSTLPTWITRITENVANAGKGGSLLSGH